MKRHSIYCLTCFSLIQSAVGEESLGKLIFLDDFERNESKPNVIMIFADDILVFLSILR